MRERRSILREIWEICLDLSVLILDAFMRVSINSHKECREIDAWALRGHWVAFEILRDEGETFRALGSWVKWQVLFHLAIFLRGCLCFTLYFAFCFSFVMLFDLRGR